MLRDVLAADLPIFFAHQNDPIAAKLAAFTPRDRAAFDAHWQKILDNAEVAKKTILVDGEVVGFVTSFDREGRRLIGYWIERARWGRGIATEALREFLSIETARPLVAEVAKHNQGSLRVLEKCGFVVVREWVSTEPDGTSLAEVALELS